MIIARLIDAHSTQQGGETMLAELPALDRLDPKEAWAPWKPSADDPWNLRWAAHLYRRAAFGAPAFAPGASAWEGLHRAVRQGLEATFDELFTGGPGLADHDRLIDNLAPGRKRDRFLRTEPSLADLQAWWLHRMTTTPHPLREKMTLFWHNHFATSLVKVGKPA